MTGWVVAAGLALLVLAVLFYAVSIPRMAREITAAALLLGLAGYAWQGNPGLAGAPRKAAGAQAGSFDEGLAEQRRALAERYGPAGQWLMMSDGLGRQGKTREAANVLLSGLRQTPDDPNLWLGLGNALVDHADGVVSPGAQFAYRRAMAVDEKAIAPRFFYGLALARSGQLQPARDLWAPLEQTLPEGSKLKAELKANIARIDALLASEGANPQ
ncbi:tetratricopeptide repeat protein [Sphingobium cloacae]|uniref:Cytochrome c biogenesis factor n=1 Tax=Sphingobium cloacae TaxID=120107 RepID=A0A1E1F0F7_9SPHN|nr:cytochrome C biosynthesis protein [Sphingobium cloacae]BAV64000.1 cytochrome c biogenesis factor [Sphingobium cloacae]